MTDTYQQAYDALVKQHNQIIHQFKETQNKYHQAQNAHIELTKKYNAFGLEHKRMREQADEDLEIQYKRVKKIQDAAHRMIEESVSSAVQSCQREKKAELEKQKENLVSEFRGVLQAKCTELENLKKKEKVFRENVHLKKRVENLRQRVVELQDIVTDFVTPFENQDADIKKTVSDIKELLTEIAFNSHCDCPDLVATLTIPCNCLLKKYGLSLRNDI